MQTRVVTLKLSEPLLRAAWAVAQDEDITVGQLVRDTLSAELRRRRRSATTSNRAEETLLVSLRSQLTRDFTDARTWADLQARLQRKGYFLVEAGGGLALYETRDATRLCKASELGYSYQTLLRRFRTPFPAQSNRWLARREQGQTEKPAPADTDTGFELVETG